jgi:hypothetical protein
MDSSLISGIAQIAIRFPLHCDDSAAGQGFTLRIASVKFWAALAGDSD